MKTPKVICSIFMENEPVYFESLNEAAENGCDLIEVRLDRYYPAHSLLETNQMIKKTRKACPLPILWTMRTDQDPDLCSSENYNYLLKLLNKEKLLMDVEVARIHELTFELDFSRVVLSYHNYDLTPDPAWLKRLVQQMCAFQPWIVKVAVTTESFPDVLTLLEVMQTVPETIGRLAVGMSACGLITRLIPQFLDLEYTFCSLHEPTAKGQVSIEEFSRFQSLLKIDEVSYNKEN